MMNADRGFLALLRDRQGSLLPIAAIAMVLTTALVGGGIDMSRAYRVQNRLQSACDSAVLAGRRAVATSGYGDPEKNQAGNYFDTNFNDSSQETTGTNFTSSSFDNGKTIEGAATTQLNLAVMRIFGFQKFSLKVACSASMGVGNSDVMMVLDTTGSMDSTLGSSTRIAALRTAMKNFYTTVKTATTGSNSRIRYGFVPFSSSVNVGRLLMDKDPGYIADSYDVQSREQVKKWVNSTKTESENKNDVIGPQTPEATAYDSQNSCKSGMVTITTVKNGVQQTYPPNTLTSNDDQVVTTQTTVQPWKETSRVCLKNSGNNKWYRNATERTYDVYTYTTTTSNHVFDYWSWKLLTYDVSSYKSFQSVTTQTGTKGTDVTSTWKGCIEERDTVAEPTFSYSTITGITPSGANDLDIDTPPSSDDDDTKWKPMWPEVAFRRNASNYVSSACPYQARLLNEMTQSEFNSYADSLYPEGSTYLDVGMTWGGRLASPQGIFKDNVTLPPSNGGEVSRHIIFMSDGDMDPNQTSQSAWGIEELDRRVTIDGTDSQDKSRHTSRFQVICAAIKAKGIRVWTISFTTGTSSVLTTCASPKSAFNADNAAELNAAFQEIAKQVGELRLTQ